MGHVVPPQSEQPKQKKNKVSSGKSYLGLSLVFILMTAGAAGGYFYYQNESGQQTAEQIQEKKEQLEAQLKNVQLEAQKKQDQLEAQLKQDQLKAQLKDAQQKNAQLEAQKKQDQLDAQQKLEQLEAQKKQDQLEAQLKDAQQKNAQLEAQRKKKEQLDRLLSKAKKSFIQGNYITPKNNSSFDTYNEVLKQEPGNKLAKEGLKDIQQHYSSQFNKHISASQLTKAKADIDIMKKISAPSSTIKKMQATLKSSQPKKVVKKSPPPKKRTVKKLDIGKASTVIGQFKSAIQARNKNTLKKISQYIPGREQFINQLLGQYRTIDVNISNLKFIQKENKAQANVELTKLIDVKGKSVTPGNWSKFEITVRYDNKNRLKVFW